MRIVRTRCRRWLVVVAIGLLVLPAVASAGADQSSPRDETPAGSGAGPSPTGQVGHPAGGMSRGVIVPRTGIDPGMKVRAPRMPRQSTPVIHPSQAVPDGGAVIVPK